MNQKKTGLFILFIIFLSQILFLFQSCSDSQFSFMKTQTRLSSVEGFKGLILINNDDPYTKDKIVTLNLLEGLVGVTEMKISHNEDCSDGQWEPYSEMKPWTLSQTNQQVSVYVRYRDRIDSESSCYGDDIVHDSTPPEIELTQKPPETVTGGVHDITLAWTVRDLIGSTEVPRGVSEVQCVFQGQGHENEFDCKSLRSLPLLDLRDGVYHFTVKAADRAGNQASKTHRWVIDNYEQKTSTVHVTENLKSDILFVIDNSGSMIEEQRELADKIDGFLNIVDELDYHIAFTTTSHHKGGFLKIKHSRNRRGFVYVESDGTPYTGETRYVLKKPLEGSWVYNDQVVSEATLLGDTILSAGTDGSGNEKGILASYKAIERRDTYPFNDFFRDEAPLSIILISDEDENSEGRNINYTPQEFKVFFEGVWPGKRLKFHSIIKPDRSRCRQAEHVGHRYKELSELTSGLVLPICAESYAEHLGHIGESIRNLHKTIPLECEPRDEDRDGDVKDDIRLPAALQGLDFSIQGRELQFTSDVPLGTHKIVYSCDKS